MAESRPPWVPISYSIASCSEHSCRYVADNIKYDRPMDQSSRWSGASQNQNAQQWLLLELESLSVLSECFIQLGVFACGGSGYGH